MALPFIAGIALGAGIAFAFTKRDQIAKSLGNLNLDKKIHVRKRGFTIQRIPAPIIWLL